MRSNPAILIALAAAAWAGPAIAQPSGSAESVVVLPGSGGAAGRAGTSVVYGEGPFDALDQPALLGGAGATRIGFGVAVDRAPDPAVDPWAIGVVVPLGDADTRLPALAVSHRRIGGDDLAFPGSARVFYDLEHDLTSIGLGADFADGRLHVGAMLHATSKSGVSALTYRSALVDSTVLVAGQDDLLFAASIGALYAAPRRAVAKGTFAWRVGAAWRRAGEDVTVESATFGNGQNAVTLVRRSAMAPAAAFGVGADFARDALAIHGATEFVVPLHDEAREGPTWQSSLEVAWSGAIVLRAGLRDDDVGAQWSYGGGLRSPSWKGVSFGFDAAREATRFPALGHDHAWVFGSFVRVVLDAAADDLDDLFDDLDRLDDWIDGGLDEPDDGEDGFTREVLR